MEDITGFHTDQADQVVLDPTFTDLLGNASLEAYTDYENTKKHPDKKPPDLNYGTRPFQYYCRFSGYDCVPWGSGKEERFGLIYQWSARHDVYLFAFRGTSSVYDMWEDLRSAASAEFIPYHRPGNFPKTVHVGKGFNSIYTRRDQSMIATMQTQLFRTIDQLKVKPRHIIVTGHSLGCALGTLFALDVAASLPGVRITNMNFASPRVGTGTFESAYDDLFQLRDHTIRVRNNYDLVPMVPPSEIPFDFKHVGREFLASFSVKSYFHSPATIVEAWHSLLNYRYVVDKAVKKSPQVWTGDFSDQADSSVAMASYDPNVALNWSSGELQTFMQTLGKPT